MMMTGIRRLGLPFALAITWFAMTPAASRSQESRPQPEEARLRAEVKTLTSPALGGRRGEGGRKTAQHLVEVFRALKLEPLFDGRYTQAIPDGAPDRIIGHNVGARLVGSDPQLRDEWIILAAHFDHLGVREGQLYPGADDNASGVAMMLEVARAMAQSPEASKRSVMFIGFDLEEIGLYGSRYFVEHSPVPLKQISLFITADMIGRSLGGVCDPYVFVMGSEHAPGLRPWINQASQQQPVKVGMLGTDILILDRSDYGPFRAREIPYLFFSTGENPTYHTPDDRPETLNYPKLEAISQVIHKLVVQAASASKVPTWIQAPENTIEEVATVRDILRSLLENRETLKIGVAQLYLMNNTVRTLEAIVERGSITSSERATMVNVARLVLIAIL
ncbi:M20/M25/M40 family metallo-hydrolase [Singulisphaera sp. Ch08]|uniref:M20/M25/M40 family metallo-hydrolase n=1 Tax=Singulisphaera sp. Ch08 TaxID=3120278 RepID=A0AAU7CRL1_9BACT